MKKIAFTFYVLALLVLPLAAQNINISADSLYVEVPASTDEFGMLAHVWNNGSQTVTLHWERTIEQMPAGWAISFCDKNLCYLPSVTNAQFDLYSNGDSSILKPLFRPYGTAGTCIYRISLNSLTPGITFEESLVYVAVATLANSSVEVLSSHDVLVFPNPVDNVLSVAVADPGFKGNFTITDAAGQLLLTKTDMPATSHLDVSSLSPGMYFLHIYSDDLEKAVIKRFIRQ